jgi:AraC family transcriptional regulator of adaptative response / DNA-3-methyladenine glycosylase II
MPNSSQSVDPECPGPSGEDRSQQSADWLSDLCHRADMPAVIDVELAYLEPMDAEGVVAYLARRAIPGVEEIVDGAYRRSVRLPRGNGILELAPGDGRIRARYNLDHPEDETDAVERSRNLFDLDTDPQPVFDALHTDPLVGPLIRANPGRRVPGHVDPDEIAFRAVLGQQVSLAGAATLAGKLVADYGEPLRTPLGSVTHLFPRAGALANADPKRLPMPASRRRAVIGLAKALDEGRVMLGAEADRAEARERLLELPGIGPWTADYVALRALRDPDAFLPSDLGLRRALERLGLDGSPTSAAKLAESWRPYRGYALMHLWATLANP